MFRKLKSKFKDYWTLYLYYNGVQVKRIRIHKDDAPADNTYVVRILFKKHLFGSNNVVVMLRPNTLLKTEEKAKKTYWGAIFERGLNIDGR